MLLPFIVYLLSSNYSSIIIISARLHKEITLLGFWAPLLSEPRAKRNLGSAKINMTLGPEKWKIGEKESEGTPQPTWPTLLSG